MESKALSVPRGRAGMPPLVLEMAPIYDAEDRLSEVAITNHVNAPVLMSLFNEACNTTNRYLSQVKLEILHAHKSYDIAKATVIIDKMPELVAKLTASGMKNSEDVRNAFIAKDEECQASLDRLNALLAIEAYLDSKSKSFVRAYNAVRSVAERRVGRAAEANLGTYEGSLDGEMNPDMMVGKSKWGR